GHRDHAAQVILVDVRGHHQVDVVEADGTQVVVGADAAGAVSAYSPASAPPASISIAKPLSGCRTSMDSP
ncbi:MAG: hypothetical protein IKN05_03785, partial [Clostridia bacterium]|nr:hypothetical protein [Clostridia bacterium]